MYYSQTNQPPKEKKKNKKPDGKEIKPEKDVQGVTDVTLGPTFQIETPPFNNLVIKSYVHNGPLENFYVLDPEWGPINSV